MLKYALLGFLNYGSRTGYQLENSMNESTANFWHAKLSQIYMTLKAMEGDGLVISHVEEQEGRPDRRVYEITEAGRNDLLEWLAKPLTEIEPNKDTLLLKLFFARPIGKQAILAQLHLQRELHRQLYHKYSQESADDISRYLRENPERAADAILWDATRRFGEQYEMMVGQWLDETIERIERDLPE